MRDKLEAICKSIFSLMGIIAIAGGNVVFIMLVIALIKGGEAGTNLAIMANKQIMPYFIKAATIAVMSGLIIFYVRKEHSLSIENNVNVSE